MATLLSGASQLIVHPLDYGSMFQDRAGTTPVTAPGQLVGLALDHGFTGAKPVPGPELVTNGGFDTDTSWTKQTGWTISGGTANFNGGGGNSVLQNVGLEANKFYEITFTVVSITSGGFRALCGFDTVGPTITSPGTYTARLIRGSNTFIYISSVSTTVGSIDNISVRELPGYHATAISDAARGTFAIVPKAGRRNLLTRTEEFDNAGWTKTRATISPNAATAPDGTFTADKIISDTSTDSHFVFQGHSSEVGVLCVYAKAGEFSHLKLATNAYSFAASYFDLINGTVAQQNGNHIASISNEGNGWYRCSIYVGASFTQSYIENAGNGTTSTHTGDATSGIFIWGAQLETGDTATAYQRVGSVHDVTEAGVQSLPYVAYNGANTAYQTPVLPAPGVDKVQVFAGVTLLSSSSFKVIAELSPIVSNNGSFSMRGTDLQATYSFASNGTILVAPSADTLPAPDRAVLAGMGDVSGQIARLRRNGTQVAQSTLDQGTGNFNPSGTYRQFYGARAGTSIFFNGHSYSTLGPVVRFSAANATEAQIAAAEAYFTARTPL